MNKKDFEEIGRSVHSGIYDYSLVPQEFNINQEICIICKEHGKFYQIASNHIYGDCIGCPICSKNNMSNKTTTNHIGDIIHGKYGDYEIIERIPIKKAKIRFIDTGTVVVDTIGNVLRGTVKDYMKPIIFGVGYIGFRSKRGLSVGRSKSYYTWHNMLKRCYDEESLKKRPTYSDCYVCEEWKCFANFEKWFEENHIAGYCLDKDILFKNNKMYSPQTCCFVPNEINCILTKRQNKRGDLPIGVRYSDSKKRYISSFTKGSEKFFIGHYSTPEEAFLAYKQAKEDWIKEVANKWKDKLADNVYEALMNYQVEITD